MTTYKTGNPIGSVSPKDLFDNSENLDRAVNGAALTWKDRFDRSRLSWAGIEDRARIDIVAAAEQAAEEATIQAAELRDQAQVARDDARSARDDAIAAAAASGEFVFAETYADALGKLPLPEGDVVEVGRDETLDGSRTRYVVEGNQLRFAVNLDLVRIALAQPNGAEIVGFRRPETTAIRRNLLDRGNDTISVLDYIDTPIDGTTSNQDGIMAAVAAAEALGADLVWPATEGDYISTESIPGFHRVRHTGCGVIRRGTSRWHIAPTDADTNTLHVAVSGLELNDGLSPGTPLNARAAMAALLNCGPVLNGDWVVSFAAGEYRSLSLTLPNIKMAGKKLLKIVGPPVPKMSQPLATLDGLGNTSFGIRAGGHNCIELRDIFLTRYREYGFNGSGQGLWFLNNVHTRDCRTGIGGENNGLLFVSGGVHDLTSGFSTTSAETYRILSRFLVKHAIGYSYDENTGNPIMDPPEHMPILRGNTRSGGSRGMLAQELATGHVNVDVSEFAYGIDVRVSSRVHLDANSIVKKNSIGVRVRYGCDAQIQPDIDFGLGTSDENLIDNVVFEGGTDTVFSQSFAYLEQRVAVNKATNTVAGTTTPRTVGGTLHTLRARDFKSDGGLRLRLSGSVSGSGGRKTFSLISRNSTVITAVIPKTETGQFVMELSSRVKSPGIQQGGSWFVIGGGSTSPGASGCRALPTNLPWGSLESPISFRVELENAADSVVIEHIELWRLG
ncbi:hypothetical protein MTR80_06365 [Alcaligenes aquatilis]|uniref:Pectate lyase superfamily protein domain-containing protein n=1 Tax=Alcaligenes aquatilis TaxID=323284 RepID=A0ABY4NL05_9BURK|nr:hypothetical protein [Alcaligenes aquatilis]UQN37326.1 hypothetical protein MTR80_06365 [Alcaligenes aquatilis]